jgi:hypothetical protein
MTTEYALAATAVNAWKMQIERAEKALAGLSDDGLRTAVAPGKNRLVYLWGHLIAVHDAMLPLLGLGPRLHPELDEVFLTAPDAPDSTVPSAAELQRMWTAVNDRLIAGFEAFTPAEWAARHTAVSEEDFATNPLRNRLAVLLSRTAHVAYHLGQVQLAPK